MSDDEIYRSIVLKYRRRMVFVADTMRVNGAMSPEERHNLTVLDEMQQELERHFPG